jgi:hypothetical protein
VQQDQHWALAEPVVRERHRERSAFQRRREPTRSGDQADAVGDAKAKDCHGGDAGA